MPGDLDAQPVKDITDAESVGRHLTANGVDLAVRSLRQPIFRAVWFATLVSNFGGLIQAVAASWLMTTIAASPDMVALVQASTTLPVMLFPGGRGDF